MEKVQSEATSGAFTTKGEAVRRRDELVTEATLAEHAETAANRGEDSASSSHNEGGDSPDE